ncbi:MAG TPA: reverse transcriptase domain-containing protein, partial [Candidatus Staskawiczbacteria bacterium]|nr:reverse transcriptase domain-containing protein [Candidatus Staskawiczbacteria bacterium]
DPKPREIFAADFRDRIVHHLLYNEIIDIFEKDFIENSFANRKGKGCHKGIKQLKAYLETARQSWYLKLDIKSFFVQLIKISCLQQSKKRFYRQTSPNIGKKRFYGLLKK